DHLIVGEVEEQPEAPAEVKRRGWMLVNEATLRARGRHEALGIEALPRRRAAHAHQQCRCESSHMKRSYQGSSTTLPNARRSSSMRCASAARASGNTS